MTNAVTGDAPIKADPTETVLSVDAMGGDSGPATVVAGLALFLGQHPDAKVILSGPKADLAPLLDAKSITGQVTIHDASDVVKMTDKPSSVLRHGKNTSMWAACWPMR